MKKVEVLFTMLKSGDKVTLDSMLNTLGVKQGSIMCLISALRNDFGAEIQTERDGRKVLSYQLTNADKVKIQTKTKAPKAVKQASNLSVVKTKTTVKKKTAAVDDGSIPTLDADMDISEISDAELADLRSQLGL